MKSNQFDDQIKLLENKGICKAIMSVATATRNPSNIVINPHKQTEFQLHKSQHSVFNGLQHKIIDYTEHRLIKQAAGTTDPQQKLMLMALISDYRGGKIAIAWKSGLPIDIRVTKEN